jgi:hypothetical protein
MKPFNFGKWHAWQGTAHIILSDEDVKSLHYFTDTTSAINWLYLTANDKDAARALNAHVKAG